MALFTIIFMILTYIKSSLKLSIYGDFAVLEMCLIGFLNLSVVYLNYIFQRDVKHVQMEGIGQNLSTEETEDVANEDEIEIPDAFRKEYNFLRENAKSLTTLFENYIQRRVSHDTLLRQFQASQENTFLQMRSRVRSDLDIRPGEVAKEILLKERSKSKLNVDDENSDLNDSEVSDENVFAGLQIFGSGDTHKKLLGTNSPPVS